MKVVILAGGYGTRISEESGVRPKPMVEVGGKPILWHIMKIYSAYGLNDFVICCGYKSHVIKEYFANYYLRSADITVDLASNAMQIHRNCVEPWKVTLIETGEGTMTAADSRESRKTGNGTFCLTWRRAEDVNIQEPIGFHKAQGTLATLTAVQPPGRFGVFNLEHDKN
jgi:glucose-1-phosphate cytidylyltransferase